jgi:hypothetical protein
MSFGGFAPAVGMVGVVAFYFGHCPFSSWKLHIHSRIDVCSSVSILGILEPASDTVSMRGVSPMLPDTY